MSEAARKLAVARTRLILDKPFLGALVLRLPLKEADPSWCRSAATDARALYYNAAWVERLSGEQAQFVLAHEALHCALAHFARRGHRVQRRWDLACDFAINPLLLREGLKPPAEAMVLDLYDGMTAEEIYPCLDDNPDSETLDQHLYDGNEGGQGESGSGDARGRHPRQEEGGGATPRSSPGGDGQTKGAPPPPPLNAAERDALAHAWRQHLAGAAQRAQEAGKLSGTMQRLVGSVLHPQLPWRALLAQHLFQDARSDYDYTRPSRREGPMILPSLRSPHCDLFVALDVSGSIGDEELAQFVGEINAIKGTLPVRVTLAACDAALAAGGPWTFEPWEELRLPRRFAGGGGTRFTPVFDWVDREGLRPDALLYFTDAEGEFPAAEPPYPVLWLVKGKSAVPWGRRIQLN